MTQHADILDQRDPLRGAFIGALALHASLVGAAALYSWMNGHTDLFGAKNAGGGAIGVEAVNTIPILHTGAQNPVAHDTQSQVPQQPAKPIQQAKKEKVSPDAIPLKTRMKKRLADVASERQRFRPFKALDSKQVFTAP